MLSELRCLELCAGAGGQAIGVGKAGFAHEALVEIDPHCCATLRTNRPNWNVLEQDVRTFKDVAHQYKGVELIAAGLPCPPFSVAGKQLGERDERNLFPDAIDIVDTIRPKAVMVENVRGFLGAVFDDYRTHIKTQLEKLGYKTDWNRLNASDFGVPQLRPRVVIVAIKRSHADQFEWPSKIGSGAPTVGQALYPLMAADGWKRAAKWRDLADEIAPTIVGGSKKHGGPDLGPTRAKRAWASLHVNAHTIAEEPPGPNFVGMPRLTISMVAKLQGFPEGWSFSGRKTNAYRQVGNAFPPPVAEAVALKIRAALMSRKSVHLTAA